VTFSPLSLSSCDDAIETKNEPTQVVFLHWCLTCAVLLYSGSCILVTFFLVKMLVTATDYSTGLGHFGRCDKKNRTDPISSVALPKETKASSHVLLLLALSR
jgi:hypothetical protein